MVIKETFCVRDFFVFYHPYLWLIVFPFSVVAEGLQI